MLAPHREGEELSAQEEDSVADVLVALQKGQSRGTTQHEQLSLISDPDVGMNLCPQTEEKLSPEVLDR